MQARHARAAAVGALAAFGYLAGARVRDAMPVRGTTLAALATVAISALVTARNAAVASDTRNRLDRLLGGDDSGESHIHAHLTIHGDHTVTGDHSVSGTANFHGETQHNGHPARGIDHVYSNGGGIGFYDAVYMNNNPLWMQGGTIHANDGTH